MNSIKIFLAFAITLVTFSACKTKVNDIKLGKTDDDAMLFSFLSPSQDSITVALSIAKGISSNKSRVITMDDLAAAQVSLESNGNKVNLERINPANSTNMVIFYVSRSQMPIVSGQTYTITASNGELFNLTATTVVPNTDFDFSHTLDGPYQSPDNWGGGEYYNVNMSINDPQNVTNYYRLDSKGKENMFDYCRFSDYFKDLNAQNGVVNYKTQAFDYDNGSGLVRVDNTIMVLLNISEEYYKYVEYTNNQMGSDGNPFAEPSSVYTNVSGGYGVLGSFVSKEKSLR